ncbi:MAG: signal recognition particle-docking protein FtsY [Myxococcota bacterium]
MGAGSVGGAGAAQREHAEPMEILIIVVVVVALVGGFFFVRSSREKSLPPDNKKALDSPRDIVPAATKPRAKADAKPAEQPEPKPSEDDVAASAQEDATETPEPAKADAEASEERSAESNEDDAPAASEDSDAAPPASEAVAEPAADDATSKEDVRALRKGLKSTRGGFIKRLAGLFTKKKEIDPALLDEIEEVLITADIGVKTADKILERLRQGLKNNELKDEDRVWDEIRSEALSILEHGRAPMNFDKKPTVIMVIGVNGVGKTTTIGKLASKLKDEGKEVILAAGDTFRAAAVLQLEVWGRRVGCEVVKGKERADPGSVIFDAVKKAIDAEADVVIADTAGRLHTKLPLMEELKKVHRTAEKALGRPADEVILVLDSTNGQNAIQQAQMFKEALPIDSIVLTKLDGTAKGGVVLGIVDEHQIPVRFIGIGERVEDLRPFHPKSFVEALFEKPDGESIAA